MSATMKWQSIETLPENYYDQFDVWSFRFGRIPYAGFGTETYGSKRQGIVYQADYDCMGPVMELITDATHWMIVTPPEGETP